METVEGNDDDLYMLTVLSFIVFVDLAHCYEAADVHQSEHNDQDEIHATLLSIILGS